MPKSVVIKTTWAINYFDDPTLLTAWKPQVRLRLHCSKARRSDYCTQEAVLSQRAAKCGLHNSVKLVQPEFTGLDFSLFCRGVDLTVTVNVFRKIRPEKLVIIRCKPMKTAKRVLQFVLRSKAFCC